VIDGRPGLLDEVRAASTDLCTFLRSGFDALLGDPRFIAALPGHLPPDAIRQARLPILIDRIHQLAGSSNRK
jgi:hypothetical protein